MQIRNVEFGLAFTSEFYRVVCPEGCTIYNFGPLWWTILRGDCGNM